MSKPLVIGIIGGGNMGEALIKGLYKSHTIYVCEVNPERVKFLENAYKISYEKSISSLVEKVDIIILAVKPQEMENVLLQIKKYNKLFISIAAGLTTKFFEKHLDGKTRVIRSMPNLPALIGKGITGYCAGQFANERDKGTAGIILEALGGGPGSVILFENESQMDAVTAVSGSGPAYVFLFAEQWITAARALGLNEKEAQQLVYDTLSGSAELLKKFGSAAELRARVTSKGGTTEAAINVLLEGKFDELMKKALLAAKKRAGELAK